MKELEYVLVERCHISSNRFTEFCVDRGTTNLSPSLLSPSSISQNASATDIHTSAVTTKTWLPEKKVSMSREGTMVEESASIVG